MAVAKLVCGNCRGELSGGDKFCPHCGAAVEQAGSATGMTAAEMGAAATRRCDVCGHENTGKGAYCESCGARLFSSVPKASVAHSVKPESVPVKPQQLKRTTKLTMRFEWWHIAAGAALLVIAGILVYSEIDRPRVEPHVHTDVSPEAAAVMKEIDQLQKSVEANPNDAGSLLRLANMLHDLSLQDPRLLSRTVETYKRYLTLDPANPDARVDLGIVYFELARVDTTHASRFFGSAIEEMQTVAKAHPDHQPAAFNLGIVHLHAGNTEESNRWFRKSIEINPNSDLGARAKRLLEGHSFQSPTN